MKDWVECDCCGKEYKIICHTGDEDEAIHCPFCGSEVEEPEWNANDEDEE